MLHAPKTMLLFAPQQGTNFVPVPGLGNGISSLQGILSDPSVSGRAATAILLGTDRSPEVLQALQGALADNDWSVRAAAVHAISLLCFCRCSHTPVSPTIPQSAASLD